jgi:tetratricopeptide repeat protein
MVAERLARCGIPAARVEMRGFSRDYLAEYGDVDIALDPFPYTGGITTCEALSMGVPVVTLAGESHGARFGVSLLTNAHLPELVAQTPLDYVRIAAGLASDPATLRALRRNLRTMLRHAPLTDAAGYVHDVEDAYRAIWAKFVRAAGTT